MTSACHRKVEVPALPERNIVGSDNFFDVWPTSADHAFIVGARGKLLRTEDGGRTFKRIPLGTDLAIYAIQMADSETGFLSGQDGLLMRTRDGGNTWEKLNSRTTLNIFALSFPDRLHGYLVGDQSLVLSTNNGGESFGKRQLERIFTKELHDYALAYQDPVFYGVTFPDANHGWVIGEMGRIWHTDNAGATWTEQQDSLLRGYHQDQGPNYDARFADFMLPDFFGASSRDAMRAVVGGLGGWVVYTVDGGKNWYFGHQADKPGDPADHLIPGELQRPPRDPLFSVNLFGTHGGIASGFSGLVLRLQPNSTWAHDPDAPTFPAPLNQVRFFDQNHGWIVGYGAVNYTEDGGKTWRSCQG